jgi:formylmethanofuran dehydrogenase subunit E
LLDKIGRFALTLYDRTNGKGIRVNVDLDKIDAEKMPETRKFFTRKRDPEVSTNMEARAASAKIIVDEFMACGRDIFALHEVQIKNYAKPPVAKTGICEICNESFLMQAENQKKCLVCEHIDDFDYYEVV